MAVTTTTQLAADTLVNYVTSEIKVLEPVLMFTKLGVRKDVPKAYAKLTFPQGNQLATSSVSTISSQGTNPSVTTWGTTAYSASLTQYGLIIQISDIAMRNSAFELMSSAVTNVKSAMAAQIDASIQATISAGTNVGYAGGKTSRAALTAGDLISIGDYTEGISLLRVASSSSRAAGLMPFIDGKYAVIMDPKVASDFMNNTSAGSWMDLSRYDNTKRLEYGKIDGFRGGVVMETANLTTFTGSASLVVYPTYYVGLESFGWGYFQQPEPVILSTPDSNNVLNLFTSIGAKAALGSTLFEQSRIYRTESARSS